MFPQFCHPGFQCNLAALRALAFWGGSDAALSSVSPKPFWFVTPFLAPFPPTKDGAHHAEALETLSEGAAWPRKTARVCSLTGTAGTAPCTPLLVNLLELGVLLPGGLVGVGGPAWRQGVGKGCRNISSRAMGSETLSLSCSLIESKINASQADRQISLMCPI